MKIPAKNFKGITYVQLNELPTIQQELLMQTIHKDLFIKILIGEKILTGCLQYKDYERWYHNIFKISTDEKPAPEIMKRTQVLTNK
jgi:hypothetical protein